MITATARSLPRTASAPWLRRLLRRRAGRMQGFWSTLLVLATMVACAWIATSDLNTAPDDAASAMPALVAAPRG